MKGTCLLTGNRITHFAREIFFAIHCSRFRAKVLFVEHNDHITHIYSRTGNGKKNKRGHICESVELSDIMTVTR